MSLHPDNADITAQSDSIERYLGLENVNPNGIMSKSGSLSFYMLSELLINQHQDRKKIKKMRSGMKKWWKTFTSNFKYAIGFGGTLVTAFLEMILRGLSMYMLSCPETRLFKAFGAVYRMFKKFFGSSQWNRENWRSSKEQFWSDWDKIGTDKEAQQGFVKSSQAFILSLVNFIRCILGETITNTIIVGIINVLINMIIKPLCKGIWQGVKWVFHAILNKYNDQWQNMAQVNQQFKQEWSDLGQDIKANFAQLCTGDMTNLTAYQNKYTLKGSKKVSNAVANAWNNTPVTLLVLDVLSCGLFGMKLGFAKKIFHLSKDYLIKPFIFGWKLGVKTAIAVSKYCLGVIVNLVNQIASAVRKLNRYLATRRVNKVSCIWLAVVFGLSFTDTVTGGVLKNLEKIV